MSDGPSVPADFPLLTDEQIASVARRGPRHETSVGEVLYQAGDRGYDFIVIEVGRGRRRTPGHAGRAGDHSSRPGVVASFLGELNLLTGQRRSPPPGSRRPGVVHRIAPAQFRQLMAEDGELSDLILRVLLARRESLRRGEGARALEILGSQWSSATHALRTWAARQELPHTWLDIDDPGRPGARPRGRHRRR